MTAPDHNYAGVRLAKQVIVMRKDLNMRKGKMIAQGAHASLAVVWDMEKNLHHAPWREAYDEWRGGKFTKICVSVNSEQELLKVASAAECLDIPVEVIKDAGLTEFGGVPTFTCLAIGPWWADEIDKITGHLPLL